MAESEHAKLDIAREYLGLAMSSYADKRDYFCAIHLAEAALELADRHLDDDQRTFRIPDLNLTLTTAPPSREKPSERPLRG